MNVNKSGQRKTFLEKYKLKIKKEIITYRQKFIGKTVVILGISEVSNHALDTLKGLGCEEFIVIDNSPNWQGTKWRGLLVKDPSCLSQENNYIIVSCTPIVHDKKAQLLELGVDLNNVIFIKPQKYGLLRQTINIKYAYNTYRRIRKQYGENLILCPFPGTGDAFITGRYLKNFIEKLKWDQYTILVTGGAFRKVLNLYGFENCVIIGKDECEDLKLLISCFGQERLNVYFMLYWGLSVQSAFRLELEKSISFLELFQSTVFGDSGATVSYPEFGNDYTKAQKYMEDNELLYNNTIILFPYANSFDEELSLQWWENLALKLCDMGYVVVTNCGNDKEEEIPGTKRLMLPYEEFALVAELCGYMIGVRSGIFDLMSGIKCKKIIIYQDFMNKKRMTFFSLNNMGLSEDTVEIKLDLSSGGTEKLLSQIMNEVH